MWMNMGFKIFIFYGKHIQKVYNICMYVFFVDCLRSIMENEYKYCYGNIWENLKIRKIDDVIKFFFVFYKTTCSTPNHKIRMPIVYVLL